MIVSRGSFWYKPYRKAGEKVRERENENEKSEEEKGMKEENKGKIVRRRGENIFLNDLKKKKNKEFTIVHETWNLRTRCERGGVGGGKSKNRKERKTKRNINKEKEKRIKNNCSRKKRKKILKNISTKTKKANTNNGTMEKENYTKDEEEEK